jgi:hypothetical protein
MDINIQRWTCNLVSLMWMHHLKCYAFHLIPSLSSPPHFGFFPPIQIRNKNHNMSIYIQRDFSPHLLTNVRKTNMQHPKTFWREKTKQCVFSYF